MPARELQRHFTNLQHARHGQYKADLKILFDFLQSTSVFKAMIEHLRVAEPDFEPDDWITHNVVDARKGRHSWPDSEIRKMIALLRAVERMSGEGDDPVAWGQHLVYRSNPDDGVNLVTREVVLPLVNFLLAQLGTDSEMLHHLARFKRQVEWFDQENLHERYEGNTQKGEEVYDTALRRFLFAQGIDYPFSQPKSASGKADVIAEVDSDDPLVCEVKLFDGASHGVPYVAKGVNQVVRYAHDYGKAIGHLVVVNLSDAHLSLPSDAAPDRQPARVVVEGVTVFMIVIQGKPRRSASREIKVERTVVTREQLVQTR